MVGALYRSMISNLRPYKKKVCPENPLTGDTNFKKGRGNRILDKEMVIASFISFLVNVFITGTDNKRGLFLER